jgi:REP element-mobilizing transposase RayT
MNGDNNNPAPFTGLHNGLEPNYRRKHAMSHTFHQLYYHFVWATHARDTLIDRAWRPQMLDIINEEVKNKGGIPIRHNAMPDHVHLLVRLPPKIAPSDFIGKVKGVTSYRVNREVNPKFKLQWQEGYGVLSLRGTELDTVSRYIDRQESHHQFNKLSEMLETIDIEEDDWGVEWIGSSQ